MQVFDNVTKHPVLRKAVTNLTWDTTRFHGDWDLSGYFEHLIHNIRFLSERKIEEPSTPFHTLINDLRNINLDRDRLYSKYQKESFVIEGYETWQTIASEEEWLLNGGLFYTTLSKGLQQLDRLYIVTVSAQLWNNLRDEPWTPMVRGNAIGTPLIRSWDPRFAPPSDDILTSQATSGFETLTMALVDSGSNTQVLKYLQDSLISCLEPSESNETPKFDLLCGPAVSAYRTLAAFQMKIYNPDIDRIESYNPAQLLPTLLASMPKLEAPSIEMESWLQIMKSFPPNCKCG